MTIGKSQNNLILMILIISSKARNDSTSLLRRNFSGQTKVANESKFVNVQAESESAFECRIASASAYAYVYVSLYLEECVMKQEIASITYVSSFGL